MKSIVLDQPRRKLALSFEGFEPDRQEELDNAVALLLPFAPAWLTRFQFERGKDGGSILAVNVDREYRRATVWVHDRWFTLSAERRVNAMLHEWMHLYTIAVAEYALEAARRALGEDLPKLLAEIEAGLRERCEAATQDLADTIHDRLLREADR
ncbi:MAG: hypothetical protein IBJ10_01180 [Phycisphaerales bacterium]|nr:hypothetical protein [Phycisphaerales bacterium]